MAKAKYARINFQMTLKFPGRFIADPYWGQKEEVINIEKQSGMSRARSDAKRAEALSVYLQSIGMSPEAFADLQDRANWPWYRADLTNNPESEIVIHSHQLYGCLIAAASTAPTAVRPCDPGNVRTAIKLQEFYGTGKYIEDGIWRRMVQPKDARGKALSNQRGLRIDPYIEDFSIAGTIGFYPDMIRNGGDRMREFLDWAGERHGVGAARVMDCGRFYVDEYTEVK